MAPMQQGAPRGGLAEAVLIPSSQVGPVSCCANIISLVLLI